MDPGPFQLTINGTLYSVDTTLYAADLSLNEFIRDVANLKGTKVMCREGGCGCCVVAVTCGDPIGGSPVTYPINSCLCPLLACNGWKVTTIEGLGSAKAGYHPIQQRLADYNGSQCGFCSPGMVMNMYGFLAYEGSPSKEDIEAAFDGNICRCTGYRPILDAMKSFGPGGSSVADIEDLSRCCLGRGPGRQHCSSSSSAAGTCPRRRADSWTCVDEAGEAVVPKWLARSAVRRGDVTDSSGIPWYRPTSLADLASLLQQYASAKYRLVAGHTGVGVYKNDGPYDLYIDVNSISYLSQWGVTADESWVWFGARVTLSKLIEYLVLLSHPVLSAPLVAHLKQIANHPVRNVASWAGNLMMKHDHPEFPSDVFCIMEAVGATVDIGQASGTMTGISLTDFLKLDMKGKFLQSLNIPLQLPTGTVLYTYKIMPRSQNAHAYVNAAFLLTVDSNYNVVAPPRLVYGGINPQFVHALGTERSLTGKSLANDITLNLVMTVLGKELVPDTDPVLSSPAYRKSLAMSLLYKTILAIDSGQVSDKLRSGGYPLVRPALSSGTQDFSTDKTQWPVQEPLPKLDAIRQTSGESQYVFDMPTSPTELHASFVLATVGNASIDSINDNVAASMPGFVRLVLHSDIPGLNSFFTVGSSMEELLCSGSVVYAGQPVAMVLAETQLQADAAAAAVVVTYRGVQKPILTIDDAIAAGSLLPAPCNDIVVGNPKGAIAGSPRTISGKVYMGEQYHFHLETQTCLTIPVEGQYQIYSATQSIDIVTKAVSQLLNISNNRIDMHVRRLGGAYGAKIDRANLVACATSLGAYVTNRPVRMVMSLDRNMEAVGSRHAFMCQYQAGFTESGLLNGVIVTYYEDCGWTANDDTNAAALTWGDNAYFCANWSFSGVNCRTNKPTRTWCRSPGSVEGIFFMECIMEHVAEELQVEPNMVKELNLYTIGQVTPFGMTLKYCNIKDIVASIKMSADFDNRLQAVNSFNAANRWRKKGLSLVPMKYGVNWTGTTYLVVVTIYNGDGSVSVAHGGIECGQGINTKVSQACAKELGIPLQLVEVKPTNALSNGNSGPTGGSITSELNVWGVLQCCQDLNAKIAPIRASMPPDTKWADLVTACYAQGVNLSSSSYVFPNSTQKMQPDMYNSYGAMVSEVELDVLTGEMLVNRLDVLYDCGTSINPELDVGQVEGAIAMGLGYYLMEALKFDPVTGQNLTTGTWEYKPPTSKDIPVDMRVSLLKNAPNPLGILGSKAVGEPPLCMTCSALFAARRAIESAKSDAKLPATYVPLDAPATVEKRQLACMTDPSEFTIH